MVYVRLTVLRKSCRLWDNVEKYGRAVEAADDITLRMRLAYLGLQKHTHIHTELRNTYCYSTATLVRWRSLCHVTRVLRLLLLTLPWYLCGSTKYRITGISFAGDSLSRWQDVGRIHQSVTLWSNESHHVPLTSGADGNNYSNVRHAPCQGKPQHCTCRRNANTCINYRHAGHNVRLVVHYLSLIEIT